MSWAALNKRPQLVVDTTLRFALTADGMVTPGAACSDGVAFVRARGDKERKCAELLHSERCQLIVVGLETGGRWSGEAPEFHCQLSGSREMLDEDALHILRQGVREFTGVRDLRPKGRTTS